MWSENCYSYFPCKRESVLGFFHQWLFYSLILVCLFSYVLLSQIKGNGLIYSVIFNSLMISVVLISCRARWFGEGTLPPPHTKKIKRTKLICRWSSTISPPFFSEWRFNWSDVKKTQVCSTLFKKPLQQRLSPWQAFRIPLLVKML